MLNVDARMKQVKVVLCCRYTQSQLTSMAMNLEILQIGIYEIQNDCRTHTSTLYLSTADGWASAVDELPPIIDAYVSQHRQVTACEISAAILQAECAPGISVAGQIMIPVKFRRRAVGPPLIDRDEGNR